MSELISIEALRRWYPVRAATLNVLGLGSRSYVKAVDGVSLSIGEREILGVIGESGCGKSTLGRLLVRLDDATGGKVLFRQEDVTRVRGKRLKRFRREFQIVFQNPYETFDGRSTVGSVLSAPLRVHGIGATQQEQRQMIADVLDAAGLRPPEDFIERYPHELSGGQLQRVSLARAMLLRPEFLVADEPVSMLDVSVRAEVLNMLLQMRDQHGMAVLFITHDIAVARYICDRIAVMYLGKIVELGPAMEVVGAPLHPYTQALIAATPSPDPDHPVGEAAIIGEPAKPVDPPPGCRFAPRCPRAGSECRRDDPALAAPEAADHQVACWLYSADYGASG